MLNLFQHPPALLGWSKDVMGGRKLRSRFPVDAETSSA
jgi:hypothetical protein